MIKSLPKHSLTVFIFFICQVTVLYLWVYCSPSQSQLREPVEFSICEKEEKIAQYECAKNISGTEC